MLGLKTILNTLKQTEILPSIFSGQNTIKLETNRKKCRNFTSMLKLNNIHSTAIGSKKKSNRKLENTLRKMKINTTYENVWDIARAGLRRKFVVI